VLFDPSHAGNPLVVLDLDDVGVLDSSAVGGLIAARRWYQAHGTSFRLVLDHSSRRYSALSKLLRRALPIYDSLQTALAVHEEA
jgi:hypothetical protein